MLLARVRDVFSTVSHWFVHNNTTYQMPTKNIMLIRDGADLVSTINHPKVVTMTGDLIQGHLVNADIFDTVNIQRHSEPAAFHQRHALEFWRIGVLLFSILVLVSFILYLRKKIFLINRKRRQEKNNGPFPLDHHDYDKIGCHYHGENLS